MTLYLDSMDRFGYYTTRYVFMNMNSMTLLDSFNNTYTVTGKLSTRVLTEID